MQDLVDIQRELKECVKQSDITGLGQEVESFKKRINSFLSRDEIE